MGNAHKFCLIPCGGLGGACERVCGEDGFCCHYAVKEHGCNGKEGGFNVYTCVTKKGKKRQREQICQVYIFIYILRYIFYIGTTCIFTFQDFAWIKNSGVILTQTAKRKIQRKIAPKHVDCAQVRANKS